MAHVYHIELTSACNLRCTYCTLTYSQRPHHGRMSAATFAKIVDHMRRMSPLNFMILHHFGEPLLHPELPQFVALADRHGLNPGFSTNGELLHPDRLRHLIRAGLRWLCVTFHTPAGRAAYEQCLPVAKEHRLLFWGRELVAEPTPYDPRAVLDYGIERQVLHTFAGAVAKVEPRPPGHAPHCDYLQKNFVCILHDGRVVPCGMDEHGQEVLGTVDDLDRIRQRPCYEMCRSCDGFRFYEPFRIAMGRLLASDAKTMKDSGWHPSLPLDASASPDGTPA